MPVWKRVFYGHKRELYIPFWSMIYSGTSIKRTPIEPILSSVVERCPLHGGVTFCDSVFWDDNICPLFGGVRCIEVSVNGGSTVFGI